MQHAANIAVLRNLFFPKILILLFSALPLSRDSASAWKVDMHVSVLDLEPTVAAVLATPE